MIDALLSLPDWLGIFAAISGTTAVGLLVYFSSHKLISFFQTEDLKDPMGGLFRVIGMLVSLMLSLTFADVIVQTNTIEIAVNREATSIAGAIADLRHYGVNETKPITKILIEYAQAVVKEEWIALADDRLSDRTFVLSTQIKDLILQLEPSTPRQELLLPGILADVNSISDFRIARLNSALAQPPVFTYVVLIGFLITMACFGVYHPHRALVVLVAMYTAFVGLVLYLILALSDPFQGLFSVEHTLFDVLIEEAREETADGNL